MLGWTQKLVSLGFYLSVCAPAKGTDLQEWLACPFAFWPMGKHLVSGSVIVYAVNIFVTPRINRIIAFDIGPTPSGRGGRLFKQCVQSFKFIRVTPNVCPKGFKRFGIPVQFRTG